MSDEETRCFLRACKPELVDFPGLVAVLAGHLAPVLREAKAEAIRRAREVRISRHGVTGVSLQDFLSFQKLVNSAFETKK